MSGTQKLPTVYNRLSQMTSTRLGIPFYLFFVFCMASPFAEAMTYRVGPGQTYLEIGNVPWESLNPGDIVQIQWRTSPYRSKWVIARAGTSAQPIVVRGIPNESGQRPVISGDGASTRTQLNYWNEDRGVIKIGGSSFPSGAGQHIRIESLEVRAAHSSYSFTDDNGNNDTYRDNAAAVFIEQGEHVVIRDCILTDSGNGLFVANQSSDITLEHSYVHGNGNNGSIFEHNTYTEALGMIYQFNRFGPLRNGTGGNNLKDRSGGLVVRYNWIEDGNRQLDLVDSAKFANEQTSAYRTTLVYGNILIEHDNQGNRQMVHYGGDSGNANQYRKGTLYFYHNTLISERSGRSTLFRLATNDEHADVRNNIFFNAAGTNTLELATTAGIYDFKNNWVRENYVTSFDGGFSGSITHQETVTGIDPGFTDRINQDYRPIEGAVVENVATDLAPLVVSTYPLDHEYLKHQQSQQRDIHDALDLGGFEVRKYSVSTRQVPALPILSAAGFAFALVAVRLRRASG